MLKNLFLGAAVAGTLGLAGTAHAACPSVDFTFNYHTAAVSASSGTTTDSNGNSWTFSIPAIAQGSDVGSTTMTLTPVSCNGVSVVSSNSTQCDSGTSGTTCATSGTQAAVTSGDYVIVMTGECSASSCASAGTQHVTGVTGTGLSCSAAATDSTSQVIREDIWLCSVSTSGSPVVTATYSAGAYWKLLTVIDVTGLTVSPDDGKGHVAFGTGTSPSAALTSASSQSNELIVFGTFCATAAPNTPTGFTVIGNQGAFYETTNSTGTNSTSSPCTGNGSTGWSSAIAAFKH